MQVIITGHGPGPSRVWTVGPFGLVIALATLIAATWLGMSTVYHHVFTRATQDAWPTVTADFERALEEEFAQRDRFMRENLDAMARRVGEMQAKLMQLEAIGQRVSGMVGLSPDEIRPLEVEPGRGGVLREGGALTLDELNAVLALIDESARQGEDMFTVIEARLSEQKLQAMMVPNQRPVDEGYVGSGFGFRIDPITGRRALHTGLDFAAEKGTPILAAAAGVVIVAEYHPAYGKMVDIDHGGGLVTRYAHASRLDVAKGDLVKRGQKIAEVGSTGRSTGPHLHFEVLVNDRPQNPARFLADLGSGRRSAQTDSARLEASGRGGPDRGLGGSR